MHRFGLKGLRAVQAFPYISFYWREDIGERRGQDVRESEGLLSCASAGKPARARCDGRREIAAGRSPRREPSSPAGARHLRAEADARLRAADHSYTQDNQILSKFFLSLIWDYDDSVLSEIPSAWSS
jgi:hypothetical protein